jgi:hypothetical protein
MHCLVPILTFLTFAQTGSIDQANELPPFQVILKNESVVIGWLNPSDLDNPSKPRIKILLDAPWAPPQETFIEQKEIETARRMGKSERKSRLEEEWKRRGGIQLNPPNGQWVLSEELALAERAMKRNRSKQPDKNAAIVEGEPSSIEPPNKKLSFLQSWGYQIGIAAVGLLIIAGALTWGFKQSNWGAIGT